ncbi:MAG: hypothetical protein WD626_00545 [Bauldia sp.]
MPPQARYNGRMTKGEVKEILDRVLRLPAERQAEIARMVEMMEGHDVSDLRLTDEQAAEVKRRMASPEPNIPAGTVFKP